MKKQISCDAHDYFEIVAMRKSQVLIKTQSGDSYSGIANDIVRENSVEQLELVSNEQTFYIPLIEIIQLNARNNKVAQHNFSVDFSGD
ncbi:Rho-binding antiterminator [Thalassotalea fusca]